jgi:adenylate cyclase
MSRAFADHLWGDPESLGLHELDGFGERIQIYRLRRTVAAPAEDGATGDLEPTE